MTGPARNTSAIPGGHRPDVIETPTVERAPRAPADPAGALDLELREVRLDGLAEGCLRGVEARAESQGVHLESRVEGGVPAVRCAPDHLERVLLNLLANALRHTPTDGSVAVLVAPDALEQAFERFWRASASRSRTDWSRPREAASGRRSDPGGRPRLLRPTGRDRLGPAGAARDPPSREGPRVVPGGLRAQYHLPLAKPPKAIRPTSAMITPSQNEPKIATRMPAMTMMPPRPIPPRLPPLDATVSPP